MEKTKKIYIQMAHVFDPHGAALDKDPQIAITLSSKAGAARCFHLRIANLISCCSTTGKRVSNV
jgi:hypothetical protein